MTEAPLRGAGAAMKEGAERFACLAFRNVPVVFPDERRVVVVSPIVTIAGKVPFEIDDFWRAELGKFFVDRVKGSTLVILASGGEEEGVLAKRARRVLFGLLLQGMPYIQGAGIQLLGERRQGVPHVSGYGEVERYLGLREAPRNVIDEQVISKAGLLAEGLVELEQRVPAARRFWAGFRSLDRGLQEWDPHVRIQNFVRSLEALIVPDMGRTRRQFVDRMQTFAEFHSEKALVEIYDLRSRAEHLHTWKGAMPDSLTQEQAHARALLRTFQAETIALYCYRRFISEPKVRALAADEPALKTFWEAPRHERAAQWGTRLDANAIRLGGSWRTLSEEDSG